MKYLITGGCGFLGANLAKKIIQTGDDLVIFDDLSRLGSVENLRWLESQGNFEFVKGDISDYSAVKNLITKEEPLAIFHLAGQVAMTTSINNPKRDFDVNALGSLNLLDSVRKFSPHSVIIYSSTNKVYGDMEWVKYEELAKRYIAPDFKNGFPESIPLEFSSPYGCSKGSADQYMQDFSRIYGLNTVVFRHSSMYGGRQFATYDQGWIGWFCQKAVEIKQGRLNEPFTISGNGKQVRDVLHVEDVITLYLQAVEGINKIKGQSFNIGGGMDNSLSLLELFDILEDMFHIKMNYIKLPIRKCDQRVFVADLSKINKIIGWSPSVDKVTGISKMLDWVMNK
ncbi:MAG: GDP-mannose 4,6-dehydratase [Candidatus Magasanikbacteria bacterium]